MGPTIQDVAEEADVSVATVSRVLNGSDRVRESTEEEVLQAVRSLDYHPNESARHLRTQKTRTVGVLLPNMHGEFFAQVTRGLDQRALENGHHILVSNSHTRKDEAKFVLQSLLGRVDGLIIMWSRLDLAFLKDLVPEELPVVLLNTPPTEERFQTLAFDNQAGAYAAVEHLADHGHERIAILTGGPRNFDARQRLAGYREAISDLHLEGDSSLELGGDFTRESGRVAVERFLEIRPRPTALFASNDSMALGVLRGMHEAGLHVPDDLALVGFDDIPMARYAIPALSTVHAPVQEMGKRAMSALIEQIEGGEEASHETLQTRHIPRKSCGCSPMDP